MNARNLAMVGAFAGAVALFGCANQENPGFQTHSSWMQSDGKTKRAQKQMPEPKMLPMTFFAAGRLLEKQGQYEQAAQKYSQAISVNHRFVGAYNRLGIVLNRLGRHEAADEAFIKAIELQPDKAFLRNNLAFSYTMQNRLADAEAELRNALQLAPDFQRARINLGLVLAKRGLFQQGLQEFRAVLPEADADYNLALVFTSLGRYQDAAVLYRRALEANPQLTAAQQRLDQLAGRLASPRADELRARITKDAIVDLAKAPEPPTEVPQTMPATQKLASSDTRDGAEPVEPIESPTPASSDAPDAPVTAPEPVSNDAPETTITPPEPVSSNQQEPAPTVEAVEPIETATADVPASPIPMADHRELAESTAETPEPEADLPAVENFEHQRPDLVGLPPEKQREIFLLLWSLARQEFDRKTDRWSGEFHKLMARAVMASAPPFVNFEHDRPDLVGLCPGTQREILLSFWDATQNRFGQWGEATIEFVTRLPAIAATDPPLVSFEHDRPDFIGPVQPADRMTAAGQGEPNTEVDFDVAELAESTLPADLLDTAQKESGEDP